MYVMCKITIALRGNYKRHTDQPTDRPNNQPTYRRTDQVIGNFHILQHDIANSYCMFYCLFDIGNFIHPPYVHIVAKKAKHFIEYQ